MPLARPAGSQPHPPRRAVAMGSHQIVFSSPIQRAGREDMQQGSTTTTTTTAGAAPSQPRKTRQPHGQTGHGGLSISGQGSAGRSAIAHAPGPTLAPLSPPTAPPHPPQGKAHTPSTGNTSSSTIGGCGGVVPAKVSAARPAPSWPTSSASAVTSATRSHVASASHRSETAAASMTTATTTTTTTTTTEKASAPRSLAGSNAMRVSKLLRDARAAVNAPFRPETPLDLLPLRDRNNNSTNSNTSRHAMRGVPERPARLLPPPPSRAKLHRKADDLVALETETDMNDGNHTTTSASAALLSSSSLLPGDSQGFLIALTESTEDAGRQVALLHELRRWLANPCNTPSLALLHYLTSHISQAARATSANSENGKVEEDAEGGNNNSSSNMRSSETERHVRVAMASVLLHHGSSTESCPCATDIVRLLRHTVACGQGGLLEKELVFEPVLHLLTLAPRWTLPHARLVQSVLSLLCECTQFVGSGARGSSAALQDTTRSTASTAPTSALRTSETASPLSSPLVLPRTDWTAQLVTLGLIPALNRLMEHYLLCNKGETSEASEEEGSECAALRRTALCDVCELYRRLALRYGHHLCKLNTLPYFTRVLQSEAQDGQVVQAVSRVLAKLVFDPDCLVALQGDEGLLPSVVAALQCQLAKHAEEDDTSRREDKDETAPRTRVRALPIALLVSRLCAVAARLTEGCARNRHFLTTRATPVLEELVRRFVVPLPTPLNDDDDDGGEGEGEEEKAAKHYDTYNGEGEDEDGAMTLVQHVVWLVGTAAVSERCGLGFVRAVLPPLLAFLHVLDFTPRTRLTAIYALMCLSNLSYYFADLEREDDEDEKEEEEKEEGTNKAEARPMLAALYETLGLIVAGFLFEGDAEAAVEATRILGNVSFTNCGRDWLELNHCDEVALLFCGHEDLRIAYNCFGIVLNLTAATQCRLVSDPELLSMLLRYTGRFTRQEAVDEAAAQAQERLTQHISAAMTQDERVSGERAHEVASDYAEQIADLVEKVLLNVHGLLQPSM